MKIYSNKLMKALSLYCIKRQSNTQSTFLAGVCYNLDSDELSMFMKTVSTWIISETTNDIF